MTTSFDDLLPKLPKEVTLAAKECWEACKDSKVGDIMSHIHHAYWLESLYEPVENRIRFILVVKDPKEHVERLRRLRPFDISKATPEWKKVLDARDKARTAYIKNWSVKAQTAYDKALTAFKEASLSPKMLKVHAQVCDCPWGKNKDIFGENYFLDFFIAAATAFNGAIIGSRLGAVFILCLIEAKLEASTISANLSTTASRASRLAANSLRIVKTAAFSAAII